MAKIPERAGAGNREGDGDPLARLEQLTGGLRVQTGGATHAEKVEALSSFLRDLSAADEATIRRKWRTLLRERQEAVCEAFNELGGVFGPAAHLMRGIDEDRGTWLDSLPAPPPIVDPKQTEEWMARILRSNGLTEDKVREIVAEAEPSGEDLMRDGLRAMGGPPEAVEEAIADWRRQGKWAAASDAVVPAEMAAKAQARDKEMRRLAPQIARQADNAARALATLSVAPHEAAAIQEGVFTTLASAVGKVLLARAPFFHWDDAVFRARELVDAVAKGSSPDANALARAASELVAVAKEADALAAELARGRGAPRKPAVDGAMELKAQGLTWPQTAVVLDEKGLNLSPHTPDNIRKSVEARLRRDPPAKK